MSGISLETALQIGTDMQGTLLASREGEWTRPAPGLYDHQWFWDSALIAIGLSTFDPKQAAKELLSLRRGQWDNGMMPHIIFGDTPDYWEGPEFWRSKDIDGSPKDYDTSAITQPPVVTFATLMVAERLAEKLFIKESDELLREMYPVLLKYHEWMYRERRSGNGLIVIVHPWETGLDNSPPWMELTKNERESFITDEDRMALQGLVKLKRGDTRVVPPEERQTDDETIETAALSLQYRKWGYDSQTMLERSRVAVESLDFNCILVQANNALKQIAHRLGEELPAGLLAAFDQTEAAIEGLWSDEHEEYFSRNYRTGELMTQSSVATFMPFFAGTIIDPARKQALLRKLDDPSKYGTKLLIPSAPLDSPYFSHIRYWRGPVWENMNWFVHEGLADDGEIEWAQKIRFPMYKVVAKHGSYENYSPLTGKGHGASRFGWTAALILDWLMRYDFPDAHVFAHKL